MEPMELDLLGYVEDKGKKRLVFIPIDEPVKKKKKSRRVVSKKKTMEKKKVTKRKMVI